jgi:hypothetical protein
MDNEHTADAPFFWKSPVGIIYTVMAFAAIAYLWVSHSEHVLDVLPYALMAACPVKLLFMHRRGHAPRDA